MIGFLCNKFLPPSMAMLAVPAVSALAGIFMKQGPQQAAASGAIGGGALGLIGSLMGDGGMGSLLSGVLGSTGAGGILSSVLGGGAVAGAGGGVGGFLQGMLNKEKA